MRNSIERFFLLACGSLLVGCAMAGTGVPTEIPACSSCELLISPLGTRASGRFTALSTRYEGAEVVVVSPNVNQPVTPMPIVGSAFTQRVPGVGATARPTNAYVQLKFRDGAGFLQNGRQVPLTIRTSSVVFP